ncbi:hypothetical protein [Mucilaginibacter sp. dw_454]|uniref:hypothetical protein n=1 Tax=Mucilaginibacter sp. dw_454 TaxID=2720079 RepID=UPI001BD53210|nr:hypothetical protein [Mucilaginibacter sp. dw_454]
MIKTLFTFLPILVATTTYAQSAADTGKHSPVRTLTYQQYEGLLKGEADEDMARVAEMNHYPLPEKVLKYKYEIDLSPIQVKKLTEAKDYLHRRRLQIGGSIIDTEHQLDSMFRYNHVQDGNLIFYANRYGLYQGELKNAFLQACLSTRKLLSDQQMAKFESLQKRN